MATTRRRIVTARRPVRETGNTAVLPEAPPMANMPPPLDDSSNDDQNSQDGNNNNNIQAAEAVAAAAASSNNATNNNETDDAVLLAQLLQLQSITAPVHNGFLHGNNSNNINSSNNTNDDETTKRLWNEEATRGDTTKGFCFEPFSTAYTLSGYPSALTMHWREMSFPLRSVFELQLCQVGNAIREKSAWYDKIFHSKTCAAWRREALQRLLTANNAEWEFDNENHVRLDEAYCEQLVDYAISECKYLAKRYQKGPVRVASVDGVFVRDDVPSDLQGKLLDEIAKLRARPAIGAPAEDRHPGTPFMVDLVHPSLYAYERGKTHILPGIGAEATEAPAWESFLGYQPGIVESLSSDALGNNNNSNSNKRRMWFENNSIDSGGLQWLPAEMKVNSDTTECKITSYINSLHPKQDAVLYELIGELFCHAVPLFEEVLAEAGEHAVCCATTSHEFHSVRPPLRTRELRLPANDWWDGQEVEWDDDLDDLAPDTRTFYKPEVPAFVPPVYTTERATVSLRNRPLQVICKIASLEIPAGKSYAGGVWHVEGTLEERIVATACYYLECTNVSGGELAFRDNVDEPEYEQDDRRGVRLYYGLESEEPLVQPAGSCVTKEGRVLAWPNTKQHCVRPIRLVDPEKPGKRTILCFFLVDPKVRVRSTATVPPQQHAWVAQTIEPLLGVAGISESGNQQKITGHLSTQSLLTYEAACERRERLMSKRQAVTFEEVGGFMVREFSLCEH